MKIVWLEEIRGTIVYRDFVVPEVRDFRERLVVCFELLIT